MRRSRAHLRFVTLNQRSKIRMCTFFFCLFVLNYVNSNMQDTTAWLFFIIVIIINNNGKRFSNVYGIFRAVFQKQNNLLVPSKSKLASIIYKNFFTAHFYWENV